MSATNPRGVYYVLACADDLAAILESNEANNCRASSTTVLVSWPDLVTTSVSAPPVSVAAGGAFTLTEIVANQGEAVAGTSITVYYLSRDGIKDASDTRVWGHSVAGLAPGDTSLTTRVQTIPLATLAGSYQLLVCADDYAQVKELDETNNCRASAPFTVTAPGP